jgi:hypothetical protein
MELKQGSALGQKLHDMRMHQYKKVLPALAAVTSLRKLRMPLPAQLTSKPAG